MKKLIILIVALAMFVFFFHEEITTTIFEIKTQTYKEYINLFDNSINPPKELSKDNPVTSTMNFVKHKLKREYDIIDEYETPQSLLNSKDGDCEDFAMFIVSALNSLGVNHTRLRVYFISTFNSNRVNHVAAGIDDFVLENNGNVYPIKNNHYWNNFKINYTFCIDENTKLIDCNKFTLIKKIQPQYNYLLSEKEK